MHFCKICENMLYIRLLESNSNDLEYYCRQCGNSDKLITKENICVATTNIVTQEKAYIHDINEYTKHDPTLPRTNTIKCPSETCSSNLEEGANREIIYLRYDDKNMKYIYLCKVCNISWKTNEH